MINLEKITDIAFLFVILLASFWSVYWSQIFLSTLIDKNISWLIAISFFGFCAHVFAYDGLKKLVQEKNYLSSSFLMFLLIAGAGIYIDFSGIAVHNEKKYVLSEEKKYDGLIKEKEGEIAFLKKEFRKNSDWSTGKRTNWSKHAQIEKIEKELESTRSELDFLLEKKEEEVQKASVKSEVQNEYLRGGILVAYLLVIICNIGLIESRGQSMDTVHDTWTVKKNSMDSNEEILDNNYNQSGFVVEKLDTVHKEKNVDTIVDSHGQQKNKIIYKYIREYPNTYDLVKKGYSIRKVLEWTDEDCKKHIVHKMQKFYKENVS